MREIKLNKTIYNHEKKCRYCGAPKAGRMTVTGWKEWEVHEDNCDKPHIKY